MKIPKYFTNTIVIPFLFGSICAFAQEDNEIIEAYEDYIDAPREIVYLHLNKSTYVKGEDVGFTAYVLDKKDKKPSLLTTNLYVSIEDKAQNIIKQKLVMVNNGVASNTFEIDSLFSDGHYNIKAYTNWMLNFNEQNYFVESFKIKDLSSTKKTESQDIDNNLDIQFLPESGHLLHDVENNIGVVIKNNKGYGMPFAEGEVIDQNNNILTTFKTNGLGIGRFPLLADFNTNYKIKLSVANKDLSVALNQTIERNGVILSVKRLKNKFFVSAITNTNTLEAIKSRRYSLLLHNGNTFDLMDLYFTDSTIITKVIELDGSPGVNILTLFNEDDKPIAERLIFNYEGIDILKCTPKTSLTKTNDSISINLNFNGINAEQSHNISASVLPQETKSYQRNHNIISYTYLQPYLKGNIENGKYYFTDIDEKKKFELDNLLLTQGWSSYNWNNIFESSPNLSYAFEQGITVKANLTSKDLKDKNEPNQLMYYLHDSGFMVSEAKKGETNHIIERLFPEETTTIKLSDISIKDGLTPASLYLQFFPSKIPTFNKTIASLLEIKEPNNKVEEDNQNSNVIFKSSKNVQELDEVVVTSNATLEKRKKQNELSSGRFGRISVVDEQDEKSYTTLWNYLSFKAWNILDPKEFGPNGPRNLVDSIQRGGPSSINFFLDDVLLTDLALLDAFFLSDIDFIEVNRFGVNDGLRSPKGLIKIYTKDPSRKYFSKKTTKAYEFPLTFSEQKKFYVPKYRYYNDDFYKHFGTIDWKPNLVADATGNISIKIAKPEVPLTLFIEGIANDGSFILEEKSISLN